MGVGEFINRFTEAEADAFLAELAKRKEKIPGGINTSPHGRVTLITMAKDEGPYVLEWVAYHHLMGFTDILAFSNDCTDGTDILLDALQETGLLTHVDNPPFDYKKKTPPQSRAIKHAMAHPLYTRGNWAMLIDFDEFLAIKQDNVGVDGLIDVIEQKEALGMSVTWRFFGADQARQHHEGLVIERFTRAASDTFRQGYGVKTLFKLQENSRLAIHRPKHRLEKDEPYPLVNGSGEVINGHTLTWRQTRRSVGYELAQVNHFAIKSGDEYLLRSMRGDVLGNHDKYDAAYFDRFNRNEIKDMSAARHASAVRVMMARLLDVPNVRQAQSIVEARFAEKLRALRASANYNTQISALGITNSAVS